MKRRRNGKDRLSVTFEQARAVRLALTIEQARAVRLALTIEQVLAVPGARACPAVG